MSHFVSDSEHVIQIRLVVQKHVRMYAVGASTVRSAALSVGLLNVNPSFVVTLFQKRLVLFTERRKSFYYIILRIIVIKL